MFTISQIHPTSDMAMCDAITYYAIVGWLFSQTRIEALRIVKDDSVFQGGSLVGYVSLNPGVGGTSLHPGVFHLSELERLRVPFQRSDRLATIPANPPQRQPALACLSEARIAS